MKPATIIKIVLPVVAVAIIGALVWKNWDKIVRPGEITPPKNQEVEGIQQDIEALDKMPANTFCVSTYEEIAYKIRDDRENKLLGEKDSDNERWAEILSKRLHAAYSSKFVRQAWYVFKGTTWNTGDIKTIKSQTEKLMKSQYLENGTALYDSLAQIQKILKEYDNLTGFIASCQGYSFQDNGLGVYFPDMRDRITRSKTKPSYPVSNCTRIGEGLSKIPAALFKKHKNYLLNKIAKYGSTFSDYDSYKDFQEQVCNPLNNQIRDLNNRNYGYTDDECYESLNNYKERARIYF